MSVPDFAQGIQTSFLASMSHAHAKPAATAAASATTADKTTASADDGISFDDLLDVINPLQHIPIVSTLYRKITGDTIKPLEKIAGDTLYGGLTGLGSSVADFAFQKITGKNFGDTVLSFLLGDDKTAPPAVASAPATATPAAGTQATKPPTSLIAAAKPVQTADASPPADYNSDALLAAIKRDGTASDLALRAMFAYQKSMTIPAQIAATP